MAQISATWLGAWAPTVSPPTTAGRLKTAKKVEARPTQKRKCREATSWSGSDSSQHLTLGDGDRLGGGRGGGGLLRIPCRDVSPSVSPKSCSKQSTDKQRTRFSRLHTAAHFRPDIFSTLILGAGDTKDREAYTAVPSDSPRSPERALPGRNLPDQQP